jgi:hypothetical protein
LRVSCAFTVAEEDKANPTIKAKIKMHCSVLSIFALPLINDLLYSGLPTMEFALEFMIKALPALLALKKSGSICSWFFEGRSCFRQTKVPTPKASRAGEPRFSKSVNTIYHPPYLLSI